MPSPPSDSRAPRLWRHVLITGAARGLGAALAHEFARPGVRLSLLDRDVHALEGTVTALAKSGASVGSAVCDVADHRATAEALTVLESVQPPVDAVFFCAAIGGGSWRDGVDADIFRAVIEVNLIGVVHGLAHFIPSMAGRGAGTLVLVSSLLDARGYPGTAAYSASKAGLRTVAESARILCAPSGVRVVLVRPGFMRTGLASGNTFRMPGIRTGEAAARVIVGGLQGRRSVIAFPRWLSLATDLIRFLPRPVFDRLARRALAYEDRVPEGVRKE